MKLNRVMFVAMVTFGLGSVSAFAAHLSLSNNTLGAGTTAVVRCDNPANWTYTYTKNANGQVTNITVGNIANTCTNGNLSLTSTDSSGNNASSSSSPILFTSSSVNVTLSTPEYPATLTNLAIVVTGP